MDRPLKTISKKSVTPEKWHLSKFQAALQETKLQEVLCNMVRRQLCTVKKRNCYDPVKHACNIYCKKYNFMFYINIQMWIYYVTFNVYRVQRTTNKPNYGNETKKSSYILELLIHNYPLRCEDIQRRQSFRHFPNTDLHNNKSPYSLLTGGSYKSSSTSSMSDHSPSLSI